MKALTAPALAHYSGGTLRTAVCIKITRQAGAVAGFTSTDVPLTEAGVQYLAAGFLTASAVQSQTRLAVDNMEVDSLIDGTVITAADLAAGKWDYAETQLFEVDFANPDAWINVLARGRLGAVSQRRGSFTVEFRSLAQQLAQPVGSLSQPQCRTRLGSTRCGINLAAWTVTGTLSAVSADGLTLSDPARTEPGTGYDGHFTGGLMTMTSGASSGLKMEVKSYTPGAVVLQAQFPLGVAAGDTYSLSAGCSGRFAQDCVARFGNGVNFQGDPHKPGVDKAARVGGV